MRILAALLFLLSAKCAFALAWLSFPSTVSPGQAYSIKADDDHDNVTIRIYRDGVLVASDTGSGSWIYPEEADPWFEYFWVSYNGEDNLGPIVYTATATAGQWTSTITGTVTIIGTPVATFTTSASSGRSPLAVSFNASGSTGSAPLSYAWNMDNAGANEATGVSPTYTYSHGNSSAITYTAKLIVYASSGAGNWTTRDILVYPSTWYGLVVQNGSGPPSTPYLPGGSSVALTAAAPADSTQVFRGWIVVSGNGTISSPSSTTTSFTLGSADTTVRATYGPSIPTGLAVTSSSYAYVAIIWNAAVDDIAVADYEIFRTQVGVTNLVGTSRYATFTDTHVRPDTAYSYYVRSRDESGYVSGGSDTVEVTTGAVPGAAGNGIPDGLQVQNLFNIQGNPAPTSDSILNLKVYRPN